MKRSSKRQHSDMPIADLFDRPHRPPAIRAVLGDAIVCRSVVAVGCDFLDARKAKR